MPTLNPAQIEQFKIDGYLVLPKVLTRDNTEAVIALTQQHLEARVEPFELEAELQYPGAPTSLNAKGGQTIRRLLLADRRDPILKAIAERRDIVTAIQQILQSDEVWLNPNHHNCVMTKQPEFSSETLWHRDTRYWNFSDKYLINVWYALGDEQPENGAMKVLPGSHRWKVQEDALDAAQFLITDHPYNEARITTQRTISLKPGDALLFSAHCFHAAGKNQTHNSKFSLVFTYHGEQTQAIAGTRSAQLSEYRVLPCTEQGARIP